MLRGRIPTYCIPLVDYCVAGWTGFKSQDVLALLGKCLPVVAMTVMAPSEERREVKQPSSFSDLEKLHRENKSRAELEEEYQSAETRRAFL